jgi:hypothetical protein
MMNYFASESLDKLIPTLKTKIESYHDYLTHSGRLALWRQSYKYYYAPALLGGKLRKVGEHSEYTKIAVNHYKNLITHLKTLTLQSRPAFEPRAANTDYKSQAQTILAAGLLDYYMREKHLERYIKQAVEHSLVFGEGFVRCLWNTELGEIVQIDPDTQRPIKEGDIQYDNFIPLNVVRDYTKTDPNSHDWYILITRQNRYDLIAKYPELKEKILALPNANEVHEKVSLESYKLKSDDFSDDVVVYELYHKPTASVPNGRLTVFSSDDTVFLDGDLPYRTLPVYRIAPEDQVDSCFGYTVGFDLLPICQSIDNLYSTVITNQSQFGVQNVLVPRGANIGHNELGQGLNVIEFDPKVGAPQPLNLIATPPEIFNFINQLERLAETISGVNSVSRGNPEHSLSGSALALIQSMSIQFSISLQQSYSQLLEDLGTATIAILRDFATTPRVAIIAGKSQRNLMKQFTGDDLNMINRVIVDQGSSISKTTAGKVQLADNLLAQGLIKTADQYIQVLSTGKLEPAIEGTQAELLNIRAENEELTEGRYVPVMITDNHRMHIEEHRIILSSPEARRNPELIQAVTAHLQEHLDILKNPANADMLLLLNQQPVQSAVPSPNVRGMGPNAQVLEPTVPVLQKADMVNMPNMPSPPPNADPISSEIIEGQSPIRDAKT